MVLDNCNAWSVAVTFPAGTNDKIGQPRRWAHNDTVTVVAENATRALALLKEQWPDATVWSVNHIGSRTIVLVDAHVRADGKVVCPSCHMATGHHVKCETNA